MDYIKPADMTDEQLSDLFARTSGGAIDAGVWDGRPADSLRHKLFSNAGLLGDHPYKLALGETAKSSQEDCDRLPAPFPPVGYSGKLVTVGDWLLCIDACAVTNQSQITAATESGADTKAIPIDSETVVYTDAIATE